MRPSKGGASMDYATIEKALAGAKVQPNLVDLESVRASFDWSQARAQLQGLAGGRLNIAHEAVDRNVARGLGDKVAIKWLGAAGGRRELTYETLRERTARFASALESLDVGVGGRVFSLCGRIPALYIAMLGTLKRGAVFSPLFSAFGPDPIVERLRAGEAEVLVTTDALYQGRVAALAGQVPSLRHIIVVGAAAETGDGRGVVGFEELVAAGSPDYEVHATAPGDMALLHFTSGTTGPPKGAVHVHEAVVAHHITGQWALDFHPDDVFWCTADPGWVTGTSYGVISPLTNGLTMVVDEAEYRAARWYETLEREGVNVWYTAPTAVRMLMKAGAKQARGYDLSALRFVASVGEPLNPEAVVWAQEAWGLPVHDNWWQTETGGIMVANLASQPIKPGSMGRALPGVEAAIVERTGEGSLVHLETPGAEGELALRRGWPSMFRAYLNRPELYERSFVGDWYLTGDVARRDEEGYFWFVGRADDLIKSAGHLIGPFEVESALVAHEAVAEAAVIGLPDPIAGEIVKAFVTLNPGVDGGEGLVSELRGFARKRLGSAVAPRRIEVVESLPRTRSGKIMRRLLKARELGEPEGDTSTLEPGDG